MKIPEQLTSTAAINPSKPYENGRKRFQNKPLRCNSCNRRFVTEEAARQHTQATSHKGPIVRPIEVRLAQTNKR